MTAHENNHTAVLSCIAMHTSLKTWHRCFVPSGSAVATIAIPRSVTLRRIQSFVLHFCKHSSPGRKLKAVSVGCQGRLRQRPVDHLRSFFSPYKWDAVPHFRTQPACALLHNHDLERTIDSDALRLTRMLGFMGARWGARVDSQSFSQAKPQNVGRSHDPSPTVSEHQGF